LTCKGKVIAGSPLMPWLGHKKTATFSCRIFKWLPKINEIHTNHYDEIMEFYPLVEQSRDIINYHFA